MPRENIISVFRSPASAAHAAKKRAWAFSSGFIFLGIGLVNLLIGGDVNGMIGVFCLIFGVGLVGQGLLLLGYSDKS